MNISSIDNFTDRSMTSSKTKASSSENFGIALQSAFEYSEARGVDAVMATAEYDLSIDPELEAMYVVSSAHKLQQPLAMKLEMPQEQYHTEYDRITREGAIIRTSGKYLNVPIAESGLPEFISYIRESLDSGISLRNALQKQIDRYAVTINGEWCAPCAADYDMFEIDTETGDVMYAMEKERVQTPYEEQQMLDFLTAFEMADDISTVLRYSYFRQSDDNGMNVERLMKGISERATKYSTERYEAKYNNCHGTRDWYDMNWERLRAEDGNKDYKAMIEALVKLYAEHLKAESERDASENGSSAETVQEKGAYDPLTAVMAAKIAKNASDEIAEIAI